MAPIYLPRWEPVFPSDEFLVLRGSVEPPKPPKPNELQPGTQWRLGPGLKMTLYPGKHGEHDLAIEISGKGRPTHEGIATLLLALLKAEDRYRHTKGKAGAEYFASFLGSVVHWFRAHQRPTATFATRTDIVAGEKLPFPNSWTRPTSGRF